MHFWCHFKDYQSIVIKFIISMIGVTVLAEVRVVRVVFEEEDEMVVQVESEVMKVGKVEMVATRELVVVQRVLFFTPRELAAIACRFFLLLGAIVRVVSATSSLKKLEKLVTLKALKVKSALPRRSRC